MLHFPTIQTPDGVKTLLSTHQSQRDYASIVDQDSLYCLLPHPEGWIVEMVVDSRREADDWWQKQNGGSRVYYGQTGALRSAK